MSRTDVDTGVADRARAPSPPRRPAPRPPPPHSREIGENPLRGVL